MINLKMKRGEAGRALFLGISLVGLAALPAKAANAEINIENFSFAPAALTVKPGTTIAFRNHDDIPHSVVAAKGEFHSDPLDTDDEFSFTFTEPGTYEYFCGLHPQMKGTITVAP